MAFIGRSGRLCRTHLWQGGWFRWLGAGAVAFGMAMGLMLDVEIARADVGGPTVSADTHGPSQGQRISQAGANRSLLRDLSRDPQAASSSKSADMGSAAAIGAAASASSQAVSPEAGPSRRNRVPAVTRLTDGVSSHQVSASAGRLAAVASSAGLLGTALQSALLSPAPAVSTGMESNAAVNMVSSSLPKVVSAALLAAIPGAVEAIADPPVLSVANGELVSQSSDGPVVATLTDALNLWAAAINSAITSALAEQIRRAAAEVTTSTSLASVPSVEGGSIGTVFSYSAQMPINQTITVPGQNITILGGDVGPLSLSFADGEFGLNINQFSLPQTALRLPVVTVHVGSPDTSVDVTLTMTIGGLDPNSTVPVSLVGAISLDVPLTAETAGPIQIDGFPLAGVSGNMTIANSFLGFAACKLDTGCTLPFNVGVCHSPKDCDGVVQIPDIKIESKGPLLKGQIGGPGTTLPINLTGGIGPVEVTGDGLLGPFIISGVGGAAMAINLNGGAGVNVPITATVGDFVLDPVRLSTGSWTHNSVPSSFALWQSNNEWPTNAPWSDNAGSNVIIPITAVTIPAIRAQMPVIRALIGGLNTEVPINLTGGVGPVQVTLQQDGWGLPSGVTLAAVDGGEIPLKVKADIPVDIPVRVNATPIEISGVADVPAAGSGGLPQRLSEWIGGLRSQAVAVLDRMVSRLSGLPPNPLLDAFAQVLWQIRVALAPAGFAASGVPDCVAAKWCRNQNLSGANLAGAHLGGVDFTGAVLSHADFTGANFGYRHTRNGAAILTGANLEGAILAGVADGSLRAALSRSQNVNLTGVDLGNRDLSGANLVGANLSGANLSDTDLAEADLTNANLTGASLRGANLTGVVWNNTTCPDGSKTSSGCGAAPVPACVATKDCSGQNLSKANLAGQYLGGVNFTRAVLSGAYLTEADLGNAGTPDGPAIFTDANLEGATLAGVSDAGLAAALTASQRVNLTRVDLKNRDLSGISFSGFNLSGANLSGTNLTGVDLGSTTSPNGPAKLTDTNLEGANLTGITDASLRAALNASDRVNLTRVDLSFRDLSAVDLGGATLVGADLTGADLTGANVTGVNLTGASLRGAILTSVVWANTICPDGSKTSKGCGTSAPIVMPAFQVGQGGITATAVFVVPAPCYFLICTVPQVGISVTFGSAGALPGPSQGIVVNPITIGYLDDVNTALSGTIGGPGLGVTIDLSAGVGPVTVPVTVYPPSIGPVPAIAWHYSLDVAIDTPLSATVSTMRTDGITSSIPFSVASWYRQGFCGFSDCTWSGWGGQWIHASGDLGGTQLPATLYPQAAVQHSYKNDFRRSGSGTIGPFPIAANQPSTVLADR